MKKSVIGLVLIGILLVLPLVLAEEQSQNYSGFNRFIDNAKLFFSSGDNKVALALEIREKEVNSAIANLEGENVDSANENLENAMKKLLVVQEKVSSDSADEVKESVGEVTEIIEQSNLTGTFERYVLEEEKTELVAKLVVEINGTEGQTLTRVVVQNENENRKTVRVIVQNENGETEEIEVEGGIRNDTAVWEIVEDINGVDEGINDWVVERTYAEGTSEGGESGLTVEGGENTVVESKTKEREDVSPAPNIIDNKVDAGPQGIVGYQGGDSDEGSSGDTTKNEVVEGDGGEGDYAPGTTGGEGSSVDNDETSNDADSSSDDSSSGGSESSESDSGGESDSGSITGEVVNSENSESFLIRFFQKIFGK